MTIKTTDSGRDKASVFVKLKKRFTPFSVYMGVVEKIFNDGHGSLSLYRFGNDNKVTANLSFETKADRKLLMEVMPQCEIVPDSLGYPEWYRRGLKNPNS